MLSGLNEAQRAGVVHGGSPLIVLINGAGGPIEGWFRVMEPLSALGTVFAYNRPGTGGPGRQRHHRPEAHGAEERAGGQ